MTPLPPLRLAGARVLIDGALHDMPVSLAAGQIVETGGAEVDLSGFLIVPGIIDLHGDGFEHHIRPRPNTGFPIAEGLASTDREAAAHGITTLWLAQGWSWEGGHRGPDEAEALLAALERYRPQALCDLRVQLRVETHFVDGVDRLLDAMERFGVDYAVFNDHMAEGLQMLADRPEGFGLWAAKLGQSAEELARRLRAAHDRAPEVPGALLKMAEGFARIGARFGSHDDADAVTRRRMSAIGAKVAEFPLNRQAAAAARALGDPILMGAPNVVRGGSQSGNIAAVELVAEGLCDALVSDYHLPALPLAAWKLADLRATDLARGWEMVSTNAARVLGLSDRGRIAPGLRADLAVIDPETRRVQATICAGRLVHAGGLAALRLMGGTQKVRLAAE